jgi:hypothetical protein
LVAAAVGAPLDDLRHILGFVRYVHDHPVPGVDDPKTAPGLFQLPQHAAGGGVVHDQLATLFHGPVIHGQNSPTLDIRDDVEFTVGRLVRLFRDGGQHWDRAATRAQEGGSVIGVRRQLQWCGGRL